MAPSQEWMCILPDYPNALAKRMEVRPQHFSALAPKIQSGSIVLGGACLDSPIKEGEALQINGSAMIVVAETLEDVMNVIKADIYYKEKVWDQGKMQIFPFKSAVRQELPKA